MFFEFLCLAVVVCFFIKIYYEKYVKRWQHFEEIPLPRATLLGHLPALRSYSSSKLTKKLNEWLENSKDDSICIWLGIVPIIFTRNRQVFEDLLTSNEHIKKSKAYSDLKEWLGDALALTTGEHWRQKRKLLTPSFHFNILLNFTPVMEKHSKSLCDTLQKYSTSGETFDAFKVMKLFSIGIISETAMGIDCNVLKACMKSKGNVTEQEQENINFVEALNRVLKTFSIKGSRPLYWYKPIFKLTKVGQLYYADLDFMSKFAMKIIEKRIQNLQESTSNAENNENLLIFLDNMLKHYQNGIFSIDEIIKETQSFMFGGFDTIATALAWMLYMLGRNQDKQETAFQEVQRIKDLNLSINDAIKEMTYIECVIKETLRLHPSAPMIGRHMDEDTVLGSMLFPKNSTVNLCIQHIQRDAKYWENPMAFKPERFLHLENGTNIKEHAHFAYVPFSAGPRNCIGQRFAMMEMKIALFHILLEYEVIALQKEEDLIEVNDIIHHVQNEEGLQIELKSRTK